jgi:hypothetical protein
MYHHLSQSTANQNGKFNSLPPLGFEPVILGMLQHLSDHSAKTPTPTQKRNEGLKANTNKTTDLEPLNFHITQQ